MGDSGSLSLPPCGIIGYKLFPVPKIVPQRLKPSVLLGILRHG
jgi:hypothetical protein